MRLPRSVELSLFRILQASLSNVHRHADSQSVEVRFAVNVKESAPNSCASSTGVEEGPGIGLAGMRERLRALGGRFEVESDQSDPGDDSCIDIHLKPKNREARTR